MDAERIAVTKISHAEFGDPDCYGFFDVWRRGKNAEIQCSECLLVYRTVPFAEWQEALDEMELGLSVAVACPHCGAVNLFPGFSQLDAFICRECCKASNLEGKGGKGE